jgi:hypothetical protein
VIAAVRSGKHKLQRVSSKSLTLGNLFCQRRLLAETLHIRGMMVTECDVGMLFQRVL